MSLDQLSQPRRSPFALRENQLAWAARYHLAGDGAINLSRVIAAAVVVTWLPLAVLALAEGVAFRGSVQIPFFHDYIPHGRYLLAVPILLLMDQVVDRRAARAIEHLRSSGLIAKDGESALDHALAAIAKAWRSRAVRWTVFGLTYAIAVATFAWGRQLGMSSWRLRPDTDELSLAGSWQLFVSAPLARLLVLRALWKLAVWVWLLARLSRMPLQLDPLHPDQRCGLRFLGETQLAFAPLIAALGVQLGCVIADAVQFQGLALSGFKLIGGTFVALSVAMILGPLVMFARRGWLAIEHTEDAFSTWGSLAAAHISARLFKSQREHVMSQLSTSEISSMTDAAALFDRVVGTRSLPVDVRQIALVAAIALVSALLPLIGLLPLADVLQRLTMILL